MAFDPTKSFEVINEPVGFDPSAPFESIDETTFDPSAPFESVDTGVEQEDPTTGEVIKGVGAEIGASAVGSVAGGIIGGTVGSIVPGAGTAVGAAVGTALGGFAGGFLGSMWAQDIEGQEDKSIGRALGAGVVSAIPLGGAAAKGVKGGAQITGSMIGRAAGREAVKGAALGGTEATIKTVVDEGRMPTKEEFAQYAGAGAVFGGAIGAVTPKISKSMDKFFGKTFDEIDEAVATGDISADNLRAVAGEKPVNGELSPGGKLINREIAETQAKAKSKLATEEVVAPSRFGRMRDKALSVLAPSKVVGKEARNEMLNFRKRAAAAEELGSRVERRVSKAVKKDPSLVDKVDNFLDGGELDPKLGDLQDDLTLYRDKLDELQGELVKQLELDHMASLESGNLKIVTDKILKLKETAESQSGKAKVKTEAKIRKQEKKLEETPKLISKIKQSRSLGSFTSREYRMFTDSEFVPDVKLRQKAQEEIARNKFKEGKGRYKTMGDAMEAASKHLDDLENKSAKVRKAKDKKVGAKQLYESPLKKRHKVGDAERAWLGEITDPGERVRGTLTRVGRLVARKQTDRNVAEILQKYGLAVPSNQQVQGMQELALKAGETTGLHTFPEAQAAINRIYLDGGQQRSNNPVIAGLQDLYSTSVGLSKATKVLLNPPSYAVQVYGNMIGLAGMGVNPFSRNASKGLRLALSEYGGLEKMMSKAGVTERKAFLKEINDMTQYGIKGENIIESDLRDAFERGLFSKAADKPVGFFGKLYSVPDTMGRYIGWKAQQDMLKEIYPHLDNESIKRLAAEVINDTYQNYDRLSNTVKSLSRMGIMPQFASFTAEFMRNQYNQAKIIKQMWSGTFGKDLGIDVSKANVSAMRKHAAIRLASLATIYGGTAGTIAAINRDGGINDENEEHIRELLPPWDENKSLAIRLSEDGKGASYANVSYISPVALGLAAFDAGMNDRPIDSLAKMVVDEFIGDGSFVNRNMMQAINNRNERGQKISSSEGDLKNAMERLEFFLKETFKPGAMREAKKLDEALRGVGELSTSQVFTRQIGYRVNTVDFGENAKFMFMEHKDNADASARNYTRARDKGLMTPENLEAVYQDANNARRESMALIARRNENLTKLGYSEEERIQIMKDAGVGSKEILNTLEGRYDDIPRFDTPSTSDIYDGLPSGKRERLNAIRGVMREDPKLGRNLMNTYNRELRQGNLTEREKLLRRMDSDERIRYIRKHPNPEAYGREMLRKGVISAEMFRIIRQ